MLASYIAYMMGDIGGGRVYKNLKNPVEKGGKVWGRRKMRGINH